MKIWCSKHTQRKANSDELQAQLKQGYLSNLYDEIYLRNQTTSNSQQAPCVELLIIKRDLTYHQINYLLGIVHPVLAKNSYCDYFTSLHGSTQKCIPFFSAVLRGKADLFSSLAPSCSCHLPTTRGPLPRLHSDAWCVSGRKSHILRVTVSLRSSIMCQDGSTWWLQLPTPLQILGLFATWLPGQSGRIWGK